MPQGCGASVAWAWRALRHHFQVHGGTSRCNFPRAETALLGSTPQWGLSPHLWGWQGVHLWHQGPLVSYSVGGGRILGQESAKWPWLLRALLEQLSVEPLVACSSGIWSRAWSRAAPRSCLLMQLHMLPT